MGIVNAEITLKNLFDKLKSQIGVIKEQDVRSITVTAMVDTGSWTLVINEAICEKLGLSKTGTGSGSLADGTMALYDMAGPLEIWWKDRKVTLDALVVPNTDEVLLGAIPLEAMDLIVDPRGEELIGLPPEQTMHRI